MNVQRCAFVCATRRPAGTAKTIVHTHAARKRCQACLPAACLLLGPLDLLRGPVCVPACIQVDPGQPGAAASACLSSVCCMHTGLIQEHGSKPKVWLLKVMPLLASHCPSVYLVNESREALYQHNRERNAKDLHAWLAQWTETHLTRSSAINECR